MNDATRSIEILKQIISFLGQHQLNADPINYTVCFHYFSKTNSSLNESVEETIRNKIKITNHQMQHWFDCFSLSPDQKKIKYFNQTQTELKKIANQLALITEKAEVDISHFDDSLINCKSELDESFENVSLSTIVSQLLNNTNTIQACMKQLKQHIIESEKKISALQQRLEIAQLEALTDSLTGLYNRKGLEIAVSESLSVYPTADSCPCILLLDIDHFKRVNDNYGHTLGDKVIKTVAETLKKHINSKDTAARYGGEEFAVLLPDNKLTNAVTVAETIRRSIEKLHIQKIKSQREISRITISIGLTAYQQGEKIEDFINRADAALYQSKHLGRNRISVL